MVKKANPPKGRTLGLWFLFQQMVVVVVKGLKPKFFRDLVIYTLASTYMLTKEPWSFMP